jgi:hypothetical protein
MSFKYDGSRQDRADAIDDFFQESAWTLAEDVYEARKLARDLLADLSGAEPKGLPDWATD